MKKATILILLTLPIVLSALYLPNFIKHSLPQVQVVQMQHDVYSETISASGKIEEISKSEVSCKFPIVPKEIYVSVGDQVEMGDVLATVDLEKTKHGILNMGMIKEYFPEEVISVLNGLDMDIDVLASQIPTEIIADNSGTISNLNMIKGVLSYPADVLAVISDLEGIRAKLSVPEEYAQKLLVNQPVEIKASALKGERFTGKIRTIFPTATDTFLGTSSQTVVNLYVKLDSQEKLKAGYSVTGKIKVGEERKVRTLPYEAINQDENGQEYVYCYQSGKAVRKDITTGVELENSLEIISGLNDDDFVILENSMISESGEYISLVKNTAGKKAND